MKLNHLELKNYRNCASVCLDFTNERTLIIGKNAQGKTNLLESIYLLSDLKSPRTSTMTDLIKFNSDKYEVKAQLIKNDTDIELSIVYDTDKTRELLVNALKTTPKNFKNVVKTVLFSTKDLLLLRGSPQDRRDWLDRAISQVYPAYDERLHKYEKIRIQKNNILKQDYIDETLLDIYNEQLATTGANIVFLRKKFLNEIEELARDKHKTISVTEEFSLCYTCPEIEVEKICEYIKQELRNRRTEEIARHQACVGPHRDDIEFKINDKDAVKFASQGQQRTLVLALKLAELNIIKQKTGTSPILLLDDVLAELDETRQNYLLNSMDEDTQTIITSVDILPFNRDFLKDITIYSVENGTATLVQ